jgi:hypothetical protein
VACPCLLCDPRCCARVIGVKDVADATFAESCGGELSSGSEAGALSVKPNVKNSASAPVTDRVLMNMTIPPYRCCGQQ